MQQVVEDEGNSKRIIEMVRIVPYNIVHSA